MKCGCSCHNFDKSTSICYSCLCDYDKMPNRPNTVTLEEWQWSVISNPIDAC